MPDSPNMLTHDADSGVVVTGNTHPSLFIWVCKENIRHDCDRKRTRARMLAVMPFDFVSADERLPVHPVVQSLLLNETPQHGEERASCVSAPTCYKTFC